MTLKNLFEKIRSEYNGGENDIILVQFDFFDKAIKNDEADFVFDDEKDYTDLFNALQDIGVQKKNILFNTYGLIQTKKIYSESIIVKTNFTKDKLTKYITSNIFPYYVGKFRNDDEYLDMTNKIFLILDDSTIIEYRNSDFDSKGTYCMFFE